MPTIIDRGVGLNIISVEVFEKMQVLYHRLMPTRPFFGVTKGSTTPIGQVRLPVTFGTRDNYRIESPDFYVTYIMLPYNAILGYPALARFMAATHHGFNVLKILGANSTITTWCNEKDALRSVKHDYREATAMFPTEWTDPFTDESAEVESMLPGEEAPGLWVIHFDGAFNLPDAGAGAVLTSPSGEKLFYAVQLYFKPEHKVSNNTRNMKDYTLA
jgi:hypothetical protein